MAKKEISAPEQTPVETNEELVSIYIDPVATHGGLTTNEKRYVGWVKVPKDIAQDLQRRVEEYIETQDFLHNPKRKIRIKNSMVIETHFCADPNQYGDNPKFSKEYGLLDPWQWQFVPESEKARLKQLRFDLYGY